MDDKLVEKVAKAIYDEIDDLSFTFEFREFRYKQAAKAAIEATGVMELQAKIEEMEYKIAQAYQCIGSLARDADKFESDEAQRMLDYFSSDEFNEDFE